MSTKKNVSRKGFRKDKFFSGVRLFIALAVLAVSGIVVLAFQNAQVGEKVAIMDDYSHIDEGADPGPFNSNPPTSGLHYEEDLKAGFYDENQYEYPEGYLVHNLEHGYVIFWYNCSLLSETECQTLKMQILAVMDEKNNYKLIAYPWEKSDVPLVLTSWGRLMQFGDFNREAVLDFINRNLNKSPEPHAD